MNLNFAEISGLTALTVFHHRGGELLADTPVLLERNRRTELIPGVLKKWSIGEVKSDITGYGKYANSSVEVEVNGIEQSWPFTMVYVPNNK